MRYLSIYGSSLGIETEEKVEAMPRSRKKKKAGDSRMCHLGYLSKVFLSHLRHFFFSGITASPGITHLPNPKLVSQWLLFSLYLSRSFQQNQHYVTRFRAGKQEDVIGRSQQLFNFFGSSQA